MRKLYSFTFVLLMISLVVSCATTGSTRESRKEKSRYDEERVSLVNDVAGRQNVKVIWVNPPLKQKDKEVKSEKGADQNKVKSEDKT